MNCYEGLNKKSIETFFNQGVLEVPSKRGSYSPFVLGLKIIAESSQVESRLSIEELKVRMYWLDPRYTEDEEGAINACIESYKTIGMTCLKIQEVCEELLGDSYDINKDQVDSLYLLVKQSEDVICSHKRRIDEIKQNIYDYEQGRTNGKVQFSEVVIPHQQEVKFNRTSDGELLKKIIRDTSTVDIIQNKGELPKLDSEVEKAVTETVKREAGNENIIGIGNFFTKKGSYSQGVRVLDVYQISQNLENNKTVARELLEGKINVEEAEEKLLPLTRMEVTALKVHNLAMDLFSSKSF